MDIPTSQHLQIFLFFLNNCKVFIPQVRLTLFPQSLANRHLGCLSFSVINTATVSSLTLVALPLGANLLKALVLEVGMLGGKVCEL